MQKIFRLLIAAAAIILGALWLVHWNKTRTLNSGEVHVRQQPGEKTTAPGKPAQPQEVASNEVSPADQARSQSQDVVTLPASDTISRTPPNGIVTTGSGRFQLYRQGDITWRMDTASGEACILFATEAQWRKSLVYEHGCNAR